jgi:hypothetical protein
VNPFFCWIKINVCKTYKISPQGKTTQFKLPTAYFAADGWKDITVVFPVNILEIE